LGITFLPVTSSFELATAWAQCAGPFQWLWAQEGIFVFMAKVLAGFDGFVVPIESGS